MKKTKTKNATTLKETKAVAAKKINSKEINLKAEKIQKNDYLGTKPIHLLGQDCMKFTEEYHLNSVPVEIKGMYNEIKTELLETYSNIKFNPKKYYISLRKIKNIAFFQLYKKKINLIVINPEEHTRSSILDYNIKTLPASVQKFWNGECCIIIIDKADCLNQIIMLLSIIIERD